MKNSTQNIAPGTSILFRRGSLSYEGRVLSRDASDGLTLYRVEVFAPGGGPVVNEVDICDGQILRIFA